MPEFDRVEQILDFAINREVQSRKTYLALTKKTKDPRCRKLLKELADEELRHKGRLESIKKGRLELFREKGVKLNIDDCCVATEPGALMDFRDIIKSAIKRENESVRLYRTLAKSLNWGGLRETFLLLAQEEAKHKSKLADELKNCPPKEN